MRLYHFMKPQHVLSTIVENRLRVSTVDGVNDPYEMLPSLTGSSGTTERICHLRQKMRDILKNTGMLCLSAAIGSPAMWSHYADRHRGVAFEFEFSEPLPSTLSRVDYSVTRVPIPLTGLGDSEAYKTFGEALIRRKASCWSYEEEYRWVFPLAHHIVYMDEPGVFSLGLPTEWKRIILGVDCTVKEAAIRMALERHVEFADVGIAETRLNDTLFVIEIQAKKDTTGFISAK